MEGSGTVKRIVLLLACAQAAVAAEVGGFSVSWNGRPLKVHPARVSAYPMNQVWAGYQRPIEQTRMASFISFDMDGAGELAVAIPEGQTNATPILLPLSRNWSTRTEGGKFRIAIDHPQQFVLKFGIEGEELQVFANPRFARPEGKQITYFGPGEHHVGLIAPASGETIVIDEGAVVYGAIQIFHAENVKVVGRGILDASFLQRAQTNSAAYANAVRAGFTPSQYGAEMGVTAFTCAWATNILVEGITIRDPPRWTMIVRTQSKRVTIDNVKIVGCWRYNADGINVCASEDVAIRNCYLRTFDDCIIARGSYLDKSGPVTRNLLAENCVLWCDWGKCLEVWAGGRPCTIEEVSFRNIACISPDEIVADVTTWYASSNTVIRNICFENIAVDYWRKYPAAHFQRAPGDTIFHGKLRDASNLIVVDVASYGHDLGNQKYRPAEDLSPFKVLYENLTFKNFTVHGNPPRLTGRIDGSSAPHTIRSVRLEGMPEGLDLKMSGVD